MPTKLTQSLVNRVRDDHPAGTQLHDAEVSGLRLVVGKSSCSWKLVGRILPLPDAQGGRRCSHLRLPTSAALTLSGSNSILRPLLVP